MIELENEIHKQIQILCSEGDTLANEKRYSTALTKYWAALIPHCCPVWCKI